MENKELITLSTFVDWIKTIDSSGSFTEEFFKTVEYNEFLKTELHLSHFIATDENGKPLEKPKDSDFRDWDYQNQLDGEKERYQQAQEKVIFEGWEFVETIEGIQYDKIKITDNLNHLIFYGKSVDISLFGEYRFTTQVFNYSQLAEVTKINPLKLKTK